MNNEAIQAVGYTDDGMVGVLINLEIDGKKYSANIAMNPDYTDELAKTMVIAAKQARKKTNVRNSPNPDKSKPPGD